MNTVLDILEDLKRVRRSSVDTTHTKGSVEESFLDISLVSMTEGGCIVFVVVEGKKVGVQVRKRLLYGAFRVHYHSLVKGASFSLLAKDLW